MYCQRLKANLVMYLYHETETNQILHAPPNPLFQNSLHIDHALITHSSHRIELSSIFRWPTKSINTATLQTHTNIKLSFPFYLKKKMCVLWKGYTIFTFSLNGQKRIKRDKKCKRIEREWKNRYPLLCFVSEE